MFEIVEHFSYFNVLLLHVDVKSTQILHGWPMYTLKAVLVALKDKKTRMSFLLSQI